MNERLANVVLTHCHVIRFRREILVAGAIIGGLAAYWVCSEVRYAHDISPTGISTIREFFGRFAEPQRVLMVEHAQSHAAPLELGVCDGMPYYKHGAPLELACGKG